MIDPALRGRVALVNGVNQGIGAAIAWALAVQGAAVVLTYLRLGADDPGVQATDLAAYATLRSHPAASANLMRWRRSSCSSPPTRRASSPDRRSPCADRWRWKGTRRVLISLNLDQISAARGWLLKFKAICLPGGPGIALQTALRLRVPPVGWRDPGCV
jgi:hypothetical protein